MNTEKRHLGLTYVTQTCPWGLYTRNGHRLLCSDGKIRAASLASTPDTFFSVPATVRVNGHTVSGYMTTETAQGYSSDAPVAYCFRRHDSHADKLPAWPERFTDAFPQLMARASFTASTKVFA